MQTPSHARRLMLLSAPLAALSAAAPLRAQSPSGTFPDHPLRLVVPYPPGGGSDFLARTVAEQMAKGLGQQVVVDNRPGAATLVGAESVARAAPDGYTMLLGNIATFSVNPSLFKKLPYDPVKDFAPIGLMGRFAMLLVVSPQAPYKSLKDIVSYAKAHPGQLNYASPGPGSPHHLAMELLMQMAGIKLVHVAYKGAAPAMQDVMSGTVPMMFLDMAAGAELIKSGKLRLISVASEKRLPAFPKVPTVAEQGYPGFASWGWQSLAVPAATPANVTAIIYREYRKAMNEPAVRERLNQAGIEPVSSTPEELKAYIESEAVKWGKLVRDAGITVN